jgi:hypothetical protein
MQRNSFSAFLVFVAFLLPTHGSAIALDHFPDKKYSNCAALNKVYPGGVAKSKTSVNRGGSVKYAPKVSAKLYSENKSKDRDHDGIACER